MSRAATVPHRPAAADWVSSQAAVGSYIRKGLQQFFLTPDQRIKKVEIRGRKGRQAYIAPATSR